MTNPSDKTKRLPSETYLKLAKIIAPEKDIDPKSPDDFLFLQAKIMKERSILDNAFPTAARYDETYKKNLGYYVDGVLYLCNNNEEIVALFPYSGSKTADMVFLEKLYPISKKHLKESELTNDKNCIRNEAKKAKSNCQYLDFINGLHPNLSLDDLCARGYIRTHEYASSVDHALSLLFCHAHFGDVEEKLFGLSDRTKNAGLYAVLADLFGLDALRDKTVERAFMQAPLKTDLRDALHDLLINKPTEKSG